MTTKFRITKNCLIAVAAVILMTGASAQARAQGKSADLHYLAVGVSKVPALPPQSQLRFADKDANDLTKVWQAQKGGLYGNVQGETLTNGNAKLADILAALDRLEKNTKTGDTAIVSLAGHGGIAGQRIENWFFVPSDFSPSNFQQTALLEWQLRERLSKMTVRGVTVILILDTCHAGSFSSADSGVVVIAACTSLQESFEDDKYQNGLFTHALIEGLSGKAGANRQGVITLGAVEAYLAMRLAQMHAARPSFDEDGRKVAQSPMFTHPTVLRTETALTGSTVTTTPSIAPGLDRIMVHPSGRE